jgi:hypothetical protein
MQSGVEFLHQSYTEVFGVSEEKPIHGVITIEKKLAINQANNNKFNIFIKKVANNSLTERDLLLSYSVGSFYNELNLYLYEQKISNRK